MVILQKAKSVLIYIKEGHTGMVIKSDNYLVVYFLKIPKKIWGYPENFLGVPQIFFWGSQKKFSVSDFLTKIREKKIRGYLIFF